MQKVSNKLLSLSKEEKGLIEALGLEDPKVLVKFIFETFSCCFESLSNDINELKEANLIDSISKIKAAQIIYKIDQKDDPYLPTSLQSLNEGLEQVIAKTQTYAKGIIRIDSASLWEKAKSAFGTKLSVKADNYSILARKSLDAVIVGMAFVDYAKKKELCPEGYFFSVDKSLEGLMNFLDSKNCFLLNEYDPDQKGEYWLKIGKQLSEINTALIECDEDVFDNLEIEF